MTEGLHTNLVDASFMCVSSLPLLCLCNKKKQIFQTLAQNEIEHFSSLEVVSSIIELVEMFHQKMPF